MQKQNGDAIVCRVQRFGKPCKFSIYTNGAGRGKLEHHYPLTRIFRSLAI